MEAAPEPRYAAETSNRTSPSGASGGATSREQADRYCYRASQALEGYAYPCADDGSCERKLEIARAYSYKAGGGAPICPEPAGKFLVPHIDDGLRLRLQSEGRRASRQPDAIAIYNLLAAPLLG